MLGLEPIRNIVCRNAINVLSPAQTFNMSKENYKYNYLWPKSYENRFKKIGLISILSLLTNSISCFQFFLLSSITNVTIPVFNFHFILETVIPVNI